MRLLHLSVFSSPWHASHCRYGQKKCILWQLKDKNWQFCTLYNSIWSDFLLFEFQLLFRIMRGVQSSKLEMSWKCCVCNLTVGEQHLHAMMRIFLAQQLLLFSHTECGRPLSLCWFGDLRELGVFFLMFIESMPILSLDAILKHIYLHSTAAQCLLKTSEPVQVWKSFFISIAGLLFKR